MINLERALQEYQKNPSSTPFDLGKVPMAATVREKPTEKKAGEKAAAKPTAPSVGPKESNTQEMYAAVLASIPQFANLGPLFSSSQPVELTESETEYVVNCVKHIFPKHIVFQFNCTNTLEDQLLENVTVRMDTSNVKGVNVESTVPLETLAFNTPGSTYVAVSRDPSNLTLGALSNTLRFVSKEVDPTSGEPDENGYEDEYQLEDIEVTTADYMQKTYVVNFNEKWDEIGGEFEVVETYALSSTKTLQDAVAEIIKFLGMQPCDRSDKIPAKKTKHVLYLSGNFIGNVPVLVRARMKQAEGQGVTMELTVRSTNDDVSTAVASAI